MNFGQAIEELKKGSHIARSSWSEKGLSVHFVPANSYPAQTGAAAEHYGEGVTGPDKPYLAIKNADGNVSTWTPGSDDALAEDWIVSDGE